MAGGMLFASPNSMNIDLKSCASCHGTDFQKEAMGKSKNVSQMSKEDIVMTLKGYKDGSYGGSLKSVMKVHVDKYSDEQIETIANQITNSKY